MSELLFDRSLKVLVVDPTNSKVATEVSGLRVKFKCEKTSGAEPNKAEIEIFNMSQTTRALFEQQFSVTDVGKITGPIVILLAGYQGVSRQIYQGNVGKFKTHREGADIVTKLECGDGEKAYQESKLDRSYLPGVKLSQIVSDMVSAMGLPKASADLDIPDVGFQNGFAAEGPVKAQLDTIMKKAGREWSIQDGSIQIIKKGDVSNRPVVVLTSNTGLIGIPAKSEKGITARSLLQAELRPGGRVSILSDEITGDYRIFKVVHDGDTHGKNWYSNIEASPIATNKSAALTGALGGAVA